MSIYSAQKQGALRVVKEETKLLLNAYSRALSDIEKILTSYLSVGNLTDEAILGLTTNLNIARDVYSKLVAEMKNVGLPAGFVEEQFKSLEGQVGSFLLKAGVDVSKAPTLVKILSDYIDKGIPRAWDGINTALAKYSLSVQQEVTNGLILGKGVPQIVSDALWNSGVLSAGVFSYEHVKLAIEKGVRWNVQKAVNWGAVHYYQGLNSKYGLGIQGQWVAQVATACESCLELHGKIVDLGSGFPIPESTPGGYYGTTMEAPPLHVNCKCVIVPYFDFLEGEGTFDTEKMRKEAAERLQEIKASKSS